MLPYYLLMSLPGESDLSYLIFQPFNPENRPNMQSFLVADADPENYGQIIENILCMFTSNVRSDVRRPDVDVERSLSPTIF